MLKYTCLSIAGFDGSGGAGIQADLKTFSALGCYGMIVLTALPVQNTCGVKNCYDIPLLAIKEQLETIFADIIPHSIKIGMLFSAPIIELVADFLCEHAREIPIVLDPVIFAKSGHALLLPNAIETLKKKLFPIATIVTPNLPEACLLADTKETDPYILTKKILQFGAKSVLLKGGHGETASSNDLFFNEDGSFECLSAAICALFAQNYSLLNACKYAKQYRTLF